LQVIKRQKKEGDTGARHGRGAGNGRAVHGGEGDALGVYNVTTTVIILTNPDKSTPYNTIHMENTPGRTVVDGYTNIFGIQGFNMGNADAALYPPSGDLAWTAVHEAGHLLGLID
jgi:hypothetical protein